jgi:hypothetical protein
MYGVSGLSNTVPAPVSSNAYNWAMVDSNGQPVISQHSTNVGEWYDFRMCPLTGIRFFDMTTGQRRMQYEIHS